MSSALVEVDAATKRFGRQTAVDAVSLEVRRGEFFSLLGSSGCGKSTLLRMIAGFELADDGEVRVAGRGHSPVPAHVDRVNMVFQNYALFPHMTAEENVGFPLRMAGVAGPARAARVHEMLETVQMNGLARRLPRELSGGQQQRVALARALVSRPDVVLLDEPLGALDLRLREELQIELKTIQRETSSTFVYVTHDQGEALSMSDRIGVMNTGRLEQVGTPEEIYEKPATRFVATFVGEINLLQSTTGEAGLRPEKIRFTGNGAGRAVGIIENLAYHGSSRRYTVRLDDGSRLVIRSREAAAEMNGQVALDWADDDLIRLRE
jgi:ABC-type Fe3+/spermidine/putrescine transport system ATPase subunit